jgi:hypothetical protein
MARTVAATQDRDGRREQARGTRKDLTKEPAMSTTQWILNIALLAWVLLRNLGTRPLDRAFVTIPLIVVGVAAGIFLREVPTAGNDVTLDVVFTAAGLVLGALATALTRVRVEAGKTVVTAGAAFAALWIAVIGGRVLFAEWATGAGSRAVGRFSVEHLITGADAWTAAFVLMALAMVVTRVVTTGLWATVSRRSPAVAASSAA